MHDEKDFSQKSNKYKTQYVDAVRGLYGDIPPTLPISLKRKAKAKRSHIEQGIQTALVDWAQQRGLFLFSIPNHGKRSAFGGLLEKRMGLMPGASDLFLSISRKEYHGFYIELKSPGNKPTESQYEFCRRAMIEGYKWQWFDNFNDAQQAIMDYLSC